jgi:hypothetical protein
VVLKLRLDTEETRSRAVENHVCEVQLTLRPPADDEQVRVVPVERVCSILLKLIPVHRVN